MPDLLPVKLILGAGSILVIIIALGLLFLILYSIFKVLFKKKILSP